MKLLFHQRFFSWLGSYDVYDESDEVVYVIKGSISWTRTLDVFTPDGNHVGTVERKAFTFLPTYDLYQNGVHYATLRKDISFFSHRFSFIDGVNWKIDGDFLGWDYTLSDGLGTTIATISKEIWNWTDTYVIDVPNAEHALMALMAVITIDIEKERNNN